MNLELLAPTFAVCQVTDEAEIPWQASFVFAAKTDEELSLVCPEDCMPVGVKACEGGWRALRVRGPLDFGLVGILAQLADVLAAQGIPIYAVSTYNTDYLLVKADRLEQAVQALKAAGHTCA